MTTVTNQLSEKDIEICQLIIEMMAHEKRNFNELLSAIGGSRDCEDPYCMICNRIVFPMDIPWGIGVGKNNYYPRIVHKICLHTYILRTEIRAHITLFMP